MTPHRFETLDKSPSTFPPIRALDRHQSRSCAPFVLGVSLAAMLLMLSCSSKDEEEAKPVVAVQAARVESKSMRETITAEAVLYPRDQVAIVPKVSAPISKFYVNRGSPVRAGQLLATLENKDLIGALTENQGAYEQAEATYNSALEAAGQDLKVTKEQLDAAQNLYDSRETLYKQGAIAEKDVRDARIALTQARNQYDLAQKKYNLQVAEGQLTAAKGKTASAEAQLSYTKIVSPINGVVTDRPFYPGETAPSGAPILTVMDLSAVVARAYVSPQLAAQLRVGDRASLAAGNDQPEVAGKVTVISPAVDPNSTTMQVWVEAPNPSTRLKPGTTVGLNIVARTVRNALAVPAEAILTAPDATTSVMVIGQDQVAHQTNVKTGIHDGADVEILSGLQAGQQVVTQGAYGLPDKTKVTVSKPAEHAESPDKPD
jgi:HlyD family secretion protein